MRKIKTIGPCMAVVLAVVCAVASTAAQAALPLPEFQAKGSKLTKNIAFNVKGGAGRFEIGSTIVAWKSATATGELEAPNKIVNFSLKFAGDHIGACEVKSPGAAAGEVNTKKLKGVLGYIHEAGPEVGVLIEPTAGATTPFVEIESSKCSSFISVIGSTIGEFGPINKEQTIFTAVFFPGNKILQFEGEPTEHRLSLSEVGTTVLFECKEEIAAKEKVEVKT